MDQALDAVRLADTDPATAHAAAAGAVSRARREADAAAVSVAERAWGHALIHSGHLVDATRHLRLAVSSGERSGQVDLAGEARMKLAFALAERGRLAAALDEIDRALPGLRGVPAARARAQRAIVLHMSGRRSDAAEDYRRAMPLLRRAGDRLGVQRMLVNRAFLRMEQGEFALAERDLLEAEGLARDLGRDLSVGIVAANLATLYGRRGDVPASLAAFERAEQITRAHHGQVGTIHGDRCSLLLGVGLVAEARTEAERAVRAFGREGRLLLLPEARIVLADIALHVGDARTAMHEAALATRMFGRQGRAVWTEVAQLALLRARLAAGERPRPRAQMLDAMIATLSAAGWSGHALEARLVGSRVARARGDAPLATALLAGAAAVAGRRAPTAVRARAWYARALLRADAGDRRGALSAVRSGLRLVDDHVLTMGSADLRVHAAGSRRDLAALGLRLAMADGRPRSVLRWAERGRATQLLVQPVQPPTDAVLAGLLTNLRTISAELERSREHGRPDPRLLRQLVTAEEQVRDHTRRQRSTGTLPATTIPTPHDLAEALGEAALVELVQLDHELHVLTLVDGRLRLRYLGATSLLTELAARVTFALGGMLRRGDPAGPLGAALQRAARDLDDLLLGSLVEVRTRPLVVSPTGALQNLPWAVLPSCTGRPVTVTPSAALWLGAGRPRSDRPTAAPRSVTVIAGPGLPGASAEARAVAEIHGTTPLDGSRATSAAALEALARADLAHVAAHGRLSADNPLFSNLLLHDGPLMVYDLERLPRTPRTVVLAACEGARAAVRPGDELLGLAAVLLGRGTVHVVAPVLEVPDTDTTPLMIDVHARIAAGESPAAALAASQAALAATDAGPAAALFVCVGRSSD